MTARSAPTFAWKLRDYRMNRTVEEGEAPSSDKAKAALVMAARRAGGWRNGYAGGITRPGGGGWFMRWSTQPHAAPTWEEWEPEVL